MSENVVLGTANAAATGAVAGASFAMIIPPSEKAIQKEAVKILNPIKDIFIQEGEVFKIGPGGDKLFKKPIKFSVDLLDKLGKVSVPEPDGNFADFISKNILCAFSSKEHKNPAKLLKRLLIMKTKGNINNKLEDIFMSGAPNNKEELKSLRQFLSVLCEKGKEIQDNIINSNPVKNMAKNSLKIKNAGIFAAVGAGILASYALISNMIKAKDNK